MLLVVMLVAVSLVACGGTNNNNAANNADGNNNAANNNNEVEVVETKEFEGVKVGMVTDSGTITDKSFNQGTWEGILKAADEQVARLLMIT